MKEIVEVVKASAKSDIKKVAAFEKNDIKEVTHISTRNENLAGKRHPETGVSYRNHTFILNGKKVEGVFPVFESKFNTLIPSSMYKMSDATQFNYCNNQLAKSIKMNPEFAQKFTARQLEQIRNGDNPQGYTWHHNEIPGKMQLVKTDVHSRSGHTGGDSLWGNRA